MESLPHHVGVITFPFPIAAHWHCQKSQDYRQKESVAFGRSASLASCLSATLILSFTMLTQYTLYTGVLSSPVHQPSLQSHGLTQEIIIKLESRVEKYRLKYKPSLPPLSGLLVHL